MQHTPTNTHPELERLFEIYKDLPGCFWIGHDLLEIPGGWQVMYSQSMGTTTCLGVFLDRKYIRSFETAEQVFKYLDG